MADAKPKLIAKGGVPTTGRRPFQHDGKTIYEWEQSLDDVNIYIKPPPGIKAKMMDIRITETELRVGLKGNPPFLHERFPSLVKRDTSTWMMDDGEIEIILHKMKKAETWPSALCGHGELDPYTQQEVQKKIMLERFQEEHPGFDFSGAEFNGQTPDPRKFMGGVSSLGR
jgi:hypothetical protein